MADFTPNIQQVIVGTGAATQVNENFASVSPAALYARNPVTSAGLTWGFLGGRYNGAAIANGAVTLAASAANYIVADRATGAVSIATDTTNWLNAAGFVPLYLVTTGAFTATAWEDHRQAIASRSAEISMQPYTVATLPPGVQGARAFVTDASAPVFLGALSGGGSVKCPVFYDGAAWVAG